MAVEIFFNCWLNYMIMKLSYHVSIFEHMGVIANRPYQFYVLALKAPPPHVRVLEISLPGGLHSDRYLSYYTEGTELLINARAPRRAGGVQYTSIPNLKEASENFQVFMEMCYSQGRIQSWTVGGISFFFMSIFS